ncbi:hypothetical protein CY34DRAFT_19276 [Suillus luteus UH-Slu-Lm8-n1]|uniref:Uncharacterized protein n=1 Tax=Suillus luteus UH-Slu-Lm8-n1 TaxID=930992 RepID=A0A0D0AJK0_9AGAM|nr:hypothetical protein CY34DRAFT_19276 [Suillus luteus UH-Slu-Lm8-n1]
MLPPSWRRCPCLDYPWHNPLPFGAIHVPYLLRVLPRQFETTGGVFTKLIPRNTVIPTRKSQICLDASPALSMKIRASFELDRMLGNGEVIGELKTSWDALLDHGHEPFDISFPPIRGVHPSLTLKATVLHSCNNQDSALLDSIVECQITQDTDAGHAQFAKYMASTTVSHLNDAVQHFQLVLDQ